MQKARSPLFRGRHYRDEVIVLCVRWYLRFSLSYRDVEELARERGFGVDHVTIWHWVQRYAPELDKRLRPHLKPTGRSWRVDETYVKVKGRWAYLYRAVDSTGQTIDFLLTAKRDIHAAKRFRPEPGLPGCCGATPGRGQPTAALPSAPVPLPQ